MKIMYVDIAIDGHHLSYLNELLNGNNAESIIVLPEKVKGLSCKQYTYFPVDMRNKKIGKFNCWINEIKAIAEREKPDIIHFLYGDVFYKFFGLGLSKLRKYKIVVALHRIRTGRLEKISTRRICRRVDVVIVHSEFMKREIEEYGAQHVVCIDYPQFNTANVERSRALGFWNLRGDIPVVACIGNTRFEKGLDILLEALKKVDVPFQLLVAGKAEAFDKDYIKEHTKSYQDKVTTHMTFLSDDELNYALAASSIIALPYRKTFEAASGPMGEGVRLGKCIVGSGHKNLGNTIRENNLGYTFEPENPDSLAEAIKKALSTEFKIDKNYRAYQKALRPKIFVEKHLKLYSGLVERKC